LKEGFEKLRESADFDFILLHRGLPEKELPFVLTQIRGDLDQGALPIFIVAGKDREESLKKQARQYRAVEVLPEAALALPEILKASIEASIKTAQGAKLTVEERKEFGQVALDALWKMSRGVYAGYDVRPAEDAIAGALRSPDSALVALEILGRLPGADSQKEISSFVLDPARDKLRIGAAKELNRHIQKYGFLLGKKYAADLKTTYQGAADPALKGELAVIVGLLRTPNPQQAGTQLFQFRPDVAPPPMEKKEKDEK
jgi:CheY-like chemotaxis protein